MYVLVFLICGSLALYQRLSHRGKSITVANAQYVTVERKDFVRTVRFNGTTEAVDSFVIAAPRMSGGGMNSLVVTKLVSSGSVVHKGDLLVEFDRQVQSKNALDREAEYKDLVNQIAKRKADHAAALSSDRTELVQAEHALDSARLDLRKNEIVSKIDAEKNDETAQEARAAYEQLKQTFDLKRTAAQAELHILEIERDRAFAAMNYATRNGEKLAVHSPIDGVAVLNSIWKGGQMGEVNQGDEVRPGTPFMQVVDPKHMQVRSRVNQTDIERITVGMPARISLDAYPGMDLPGRTENVSVVGQKSQLNEKVRYYPVVFSMTGNDPRLMPDLSASVDVELKRISGVLVVPRDCIIHSTSGDSVLASAGGAPRRLPVTVGELSDTEAVIVSGVEQGMRVLRNAQTSEAAQ